MNHIVASLLTAVCALSVSQLAQAELKVGEQAPDFTAQAALAGQVSSFSLAQALKSGPVVLYFYPAAFTTGCTIEAHLFAEAIDKYKALGATVIGVSNDQLDTLKQFSLSACGSKHRSKDHEVLRCRLDVQDQLRQSCLLRHRARSHHCLRIHQHES